MIKNKEILIFESEQILAEKENQTIETKFDDLLFDLKDLKGETKLREVKTRVNQNVFRQIVAANYSGKCAITGIDIPELLFASHIIPWAKNEAETAVTKITLPEIRRYFLFFFFCRKKNSSNRAKIILMDRQTTSGPHSRDTRPFCRCGRCSGCRCRLP